jgi:hypothetical protein
VPRPARSGAGPAAWPCATPTAASDTTAGQLAGRDQRLHRRSRRAAASAPHPTSATGTQEPGGGEAPLVWYASSA